MTYLVCQALPGKTLEQNITAALACFRLRSEGRAPAFVAVHESQACQHPLVCVVTQAEGAIIARDTFWMPTS